MKILRHPDVVTVDQVNELKPFIANTNQLVVDWVRQGQTGLLETAQGFDLSIDLLYTDTEGRVQKLYPYCTSRNINPLAFAGASFIPHKFLGNVLMNLRTFPIRVGDASTLGSKMVLKFDDGSEHPIGEGIGCMIQDYTTHKTSIMQPDETKALLKEDHELYLGNKRIRGVYVVGSSGGIYPDQKELSWEEVSAYAGIPVEEKTSLTKRIRRVFSFSNMQLANSTMACMPDFISINFVNYLDASISNRSGQIEREALKAEHPKVAEFVKNVVDNQYWKGYYAGRVCYLGTGPKRSDILEII
jgi:hypothetical protein